MGEVDKRLREMGLALPEPPAPLAQYVPAKLVGDMVYCSGQLPMAEGGLRCTGQVGAGVALEEGRECARLCALNCLAAVKGVVGDLGRVAEVVQVRGFVNSAPGFDMQPEVVNGASELLVELFGDAGRHVRSAVGTNSLPRNAPVELEMVVRVAVSTGDARGKRGC